MTRVLSWLNILIAFLGGLLLMASLYQLEIIYINLASKTWYELPFYFISHPECQIPSDCYSRWMAIWRDVCYSLVLLSTLIFGLAMYRAPSKAPGTR